MKLNKFLVKSALVLLVVAASAHTVAAQVQGEPELLSMPNVVVPAEAAATGLGGIVRVRVSVSGDGSVTAVQDVSGPDAVCRSIARADVVALRETARAAAMTARFKPDSRDENSRLSSAILSFKFPASKLKTTPVYTAGAANSKEEPQPQTGKPAQNSDGKFTILGTADGSTLATGGPPVDAGPLATGIDKGSDLTSGGVMNGKAVYLAKPPYPPAARAVGATGTLIVQVLIERTGEVFAAQVVSGHPLLRAASVNAACESKFSPLTLSGRPVRVRGIIVYNFVP